MNSSTSPPFTYPRPIDKELVDAAYRGDLQRVANALTNGADPLYGEVESLTASAMGNHADCVALLAPLVPQVDRAMRAAVEYNHYPIAEFLRPLCTEPRVSQLKRMIVEFAKVDQPHLMTWALDTLDEQHQDHALEIKTEALLMAVGYYQQNNVQVLLTAGAHPKHHYWASLVHATIAVTNQASPCAQSILTTITDHMSIEDIQEAVRDMHIHKSGKVALIQRILEERVLQDLQEAVDPLVQTKHGRPVAKM